MSLVGREWAKVLVLDARWKATIRILLGCLWTASSVVLIIIAFNVKAIEEARTFDHHREVAAVQTACEHSQVFGVPLVEHIERVEAKLHTGALEHQDGSPVTVEYPKGSGRRVSVLAFYRSTIPASCPK